MRFRFSVTGENLEAAEVALARRFVQEIYRGEVTIGWSGYGDKLDMLRAFIDAENPEDAEHRIRDALPEGNYRVRRVDRGAARGGETGVT